MAYELIKLPYAVDALEPYIDARTMEIHHDKHHATYVAKLAAALEPHPDLAAKPLDEVLADLSRVPESSRAAVRNNGGGAWNHTLFWQVMAPKAGGKPKGALAKAVEASFGSFEDFKSKFSQAAVNRFGSGWAWLTVKQGALCVCSSPNQDSPIMKGVSECPGIPILTLDVWEHAYYLKYQNKRPDYVEAWWNVVNWDYVAGLYEQAVK